MSLDAATASKTLLAILANSLLILLANESAAKPIAAEITVVAPVTAENCMAASPSRRAASGIV